MKTDNEYLDLVKNIKKKRLKDWEDKLSEDPFRLRQSFRIRTFYINDIRSIIDENLSDKKKIEEIKKILEADYISAKEYYDSYRNGACPVTYMYNKT